MRLAFSNFGEVMVVFKGRHKLNKNIRNYKRHVKIFLMGGSSDATKKDYFLRWYHKGYPLCRKGGAVLQGEKWWCCDSSHPWRIFPYNYSHPRKLGPSLTEQCDPPQENQLSEHSMSSSEINPSDIPRENKVAVVENTFVGVILGGKTWLGSGSESDSTSASDSKSDLILFLKWNFYQRNCRLCLCQLLHRSL